MMIINDKSFFPSILFSSLILIEHSLQSTISFFFQTEKREKKRERVKKGISRRCRFLFFSSLALFQHLAFIFFTSSSSSFFLSMTNVYLIQASHCYGAFQRVCQGLRLARSIPSVLPREYRQFSKHYYSTIYCFGKNLSENEMIFFR